MDRQFIYCFCLPRNFTHSVELRGTEIQVGEQVEENKAQLPWNSGYKTKFCSMSVSKV